jgi:hypothetical protein
MYLHLHDAILPVSARLGPVNFCGSKSFADRYEDEFAAYSTV